MTNYGAFCDYFCYSLVLYFYIPYICNEKHFSYHKSIYKHNTKNL